MNHHIFYSGAILLMLLLNACHHEPSGPEEEIASVPDYTMVEIQGCEYMRFLTTHEFAVLTHKGNCKNPIHCYNKIDKP